MRLKARKFCEKYRAEMAATLTPIPDCYTILKVPRTASVQAIRKQHTLLDSKYHLGEETRAKKDQLKYAFYMLESEELRRAYNLSLAAEVEAMKTQEPKEKSNRKRKRDAKEAKVVEENQVEVEESEETEKEARREAKRQRKLAKAAKKEEQKVEMPCEGLSDDEATSEEDSSEARRLHKLAKASRKQAREEKQLRRSPQKSEEQQSDDKLARQPKPRPLVVSKILRPEVREAMAADAEYVVSRQERQRAEREAKEARLAAEAEKARLCKISRETEVFRFKDLPAEIRIMIYKYTLIKRKTTKGQHTCKKPALLRALKWDPNLGPESKETFYKINMPEYCILRSSQTEKAKKGVIEMLKAMNLMIRKSPHTSLFCFIITNIRNSLVPATATSEDFSLALLRATNIEHLTMTLNYHIKPQSAASLTIQGLHHVINSYIHHYKKLKSIRLNIRGRHGLNGERPIADSVKILDKVLGVKGVPTTPREKWMGGRFGQTFEKAWTWKVEGPKGVFAMKQRKKHIKFHKD